MIATASFLEDMPLENARPGTLLDVYELMGSTPKFFHRVSGTVVSAERKQTQLYHLITASGIEIELAPEQELVVLNGGTSQAQNCGSNLIAVMQPNGNFRWERVAAFTEKGPGWVSALNVPKYFCASLNPNLGFVLCSGT